MEIFESKIRQFNISDLHGDLNVRINFDTNIMILVGENGLGKTTILNIIYYTLSCEFKKLSRIKFKTIEILFTDDIEPIVINRSDLIPHRENRILIESGYANRIMTREEYRKHAEGFYIDKDEEYYLIEEELRSYSTLVKYYREKIESHMKEKILYFPTYRRIEEELHKIRPSNRTVEKRYTEEDRNIIQFGMNDVKDTIKGLLDEIKSSSLNGYTQVTGKMITQLVDVNSQTGITDEAKKNILDNKTIDIILSRIDDQNLSIEYKQKIRNLIKSKEIFDAKLYKPLIHLLSDLIRVYNQQQKKQDQAIKNFVAVCNDYLVNKYFEYDEIALTLDVYSKKKKKKVDLSNLSSGEKQIISIFSKLFLSIEEDFILLFDEPELSLSLEWQEKLLVDIVKSGKCKFLLAVTHSPFIYNNALKKFARGIDMFIEENENGND